MWERERKIKKCFFVLEGPDSKARANTMAFGFLVLFSFQIYFPDIWHWANPIAPLVGVCTSLIFFSVLNVCSGLDAISQLSAPVTYVRPRLCNSLIYLLWIFMNCKAIKAQFCSMLSNCNSHRLQWERQRVLSTSEMWSLLQSCVLVIMLMLYH